MLLDDLLLLKDEWLTKLEFRSVFIYLLGLLFGDLDYFLMELLRFSNCLSTLKSVRVFCRAGVALRFLPIYWAGLNLFSID